MTKYLSALLLIVGFAYAQQTVISPDQAYSVRNQIGKGAGTRIAFSQVQQTQTPASAAPSFFFWRLCNNTCTDSQKFAYVLWVDAGTFVWINGILRLDLYVKCPTCDPDQIFTTRMLRKVPAVRTVTGPKYDGSARLPRPVK